MQILENVLLRDFTTLRVGGPARYFAEVASEDDAARIHAFALEKDRPLFVLGGGSNVLVADEGFDGVVARIAIAGVTRTPLPGGPRVRVRAAAGEIWDRVVSEAVRAGLAGIECLSGIPGTVGGTPVQNVGAYGQEVSRTIVSVRVFDRARAVVRDLGADECTFGYRSSRFNTTESGRFVILAVEFALAAGAPPTLEHQELRARFEGARPTLAAVREAVLAIRRTKGMLLAPGEDECLSAGSFFKNPIVSAEVYRSLSEAGDGAVPAYPAGEGTMKLSAAWLLERAGYKRGMTYGGAGISIRHSLALVNRGHAAARDLFNLACDIRRTVRGRFGVMLEPEPVLLGFEPSLDA